MNLVCIHGNSQDKSIFDGIMVPGFKKITLDLPGHGQTPLKETNSFLDLVDFVHHQIKDLNDVVLFGCSLGGHIAHHLLGKMTPRAIISIGSPPLNLASASKAFMPHPLVNLLFQSEVSVVESQALADSMLSLRKDQMVGLSVIIRNTDPKVREVLALSLSRGEFLDEVELLEKFSGKKILIVPSDDHFINREYIKSLTLAEIFEIEGNHALTVDNPVAINELLAKELV